MLFERIGRRGPAVALAAALLAVAGCGDKMGQVDGKLVWADGTPAKELAGSQVVFESAATRTSARGTVGPEGNFRLGTKAPDDGAPVGEYQVVVVEHRKNANAEGTVLMPALLAPKYGELKTSGLTATVKSGVTPVTLTVERAGKN
jgi:hypothetical protein